MTDRHRDIDPIAYIRSDFSEKFGIPRQSGLAPDCKGRIVFLPPFRQAEAVRGLEEFSHIWLLWDFSLHHDTTFNATVRPPRLGGKTHIGVFASRSPFRPNALGLSCVRLDSIEYHATKGPVLHVSGIDLLDKTPIYDIKPYIPYTDCHPEATEAYSAMTRQHLLEVDFPPELLNRLPKNRRDAAVQVLALDPRPTFFQAPERVYGVSFAGFNIKFVIEANKVVVQKVERIKTALP